LPEEGSAAVDPSRGAGVAADAAKPSHILADDGVDVLSLSLAGHEDENSPLDVTEASKVSVDAHDGVLSTTQVGPNASESAVELETSEDVGPKLSPVSPAIPLSENLDEGTDSDGSDLCGGAKHLGSTKRRRSPSLLELKASESNRDERYRAYLRCYAPSVDGPRCLSVMLVNSARKRTVIVD
jgi:hypothetical protein